MAPKVYAAGFASRYGSANCGWIALSDHTLLIDLPHGIAIPEFLAEVGKITGKPVTTAILTHSEEGDSENLDALRQHGIAILPSPSTKTSLGDTTVQAEFIPYGSPTGQPGAAIYLADQKVLFAGPLVVHGPRLKLPKSDTQAWISALAQMQKLSVDKVVPGCGSWGGPELIERQSNFLHELRRQIAYRISLAQPFELIAKEVALPPSFYVWMPYDTVTSEDIQHVYDELTVPMAPFNGHAPQQKDSRPHALVLIGDRVHEPEHTEAGLRPVFEATGVVPHFLFDVRGLSAENLAQVKLLVVLRDGYIFPDGVGKIWMTPEQEKAVVDFVHAGGGFLNLHNSMGLYPDNGPYLELCGGRYIGHGPLERFRTEVVDGAHPITRGVSDFFTADEQHTPPCDTNKVHLLLRNRSDDGTVAAAGWAYEPGHGRFCHLANGHTREALLNPMFQRLLRNAVNWCLKRDNAESP
ncbi:MAG TPA: ThuA domain-containing protein [Candidatus Cybelea sp.]|nr:ThuA domain-containing protein [Candidatus Cybelea sp.]